MGRKRKPRYVREFKGNALVAIFRHTRLLVEFVREFADLRGLGDALDFERAAVDDRVFVSEDLRKGERDILWKVPYRKPGKHLVLLIEHQSAVDFEMPVRLLDYMHAIRQDHKAAVPAKVRAGKDFRWPLVLPIVFYTGARRWTGARRLADVTQDGRRFRDMVPEFRFQLVDAVRLNGRALAAPGSFARAIVRLIRAFALNPVCMAEITAALEAMRPYWKSPELDQIRIVLYHYVSAHALPAPARRRLQRLLSREERMPKAEIFTEAFYDKWMWKAHREGAAKVSAATLQKEIAAIRQFFTRKRLNWTAYGKDIRKFRDHDQAVEFLIDLATAADPAAFLRRKFGR